MAQRLLNFCQSGEISAHLVTLIQAHILIGKKILKRLTVIYLLQMLVPVYIFISDERFTFGQWLWLSW